MSIDQHTSSKEYLLNCLARHIIGLSKGKMMSLSALMTKKQTPEFMADIRRRIKIINRERKG